MCPWDNFKQHCSNNGQCIYDPSIQATPFCKCNAYFTLDKDPISESLDLKASLIEDADMKKHAADIIRKKYGMMAKMIMKGPDKNRAIIKLEERRG